MTTTATAARPWLGLALIVAASLSFSVAVLAVPPIYAGGGNPFGLLVVRNLGFAAALALVLTLAGRPVRLAAAERNGSFLIGVIFAAQSWCFYSALARLPVGLATLVVFLYPLLVALVMRASEGERLTAGRVAALVTALAGLALALEVGADGLDWRGVGLAFVAAFGSAAMAVVGGRVLGRADSWRMTLHMCLATGAVLLAAALASGAGLAFPSTPDGLVGLAVAILFYTAGIAGYFRAIQIAGPTRTAMVSNVEPVGTLLLAAPVWGDPLGPFQVAGAALVVGAILATQRAGLRR